MAYVELVDRPVPEVYDEVEEMDDE
jgi:hypothetical protein